MSISPRQRVRIATRIRDQLSALKAHRQRQARLRLGDLADRMERLQSLQRRLARCEDRGWPRAAARLLRDADAAVREIPYLVQDVQHMLQGCRVELPSVQNIHADLVQADQEFPALIYYSDRHTLAVQTEAIELDGVYLGPFEVQLHVPGLAERPNSAFRVVALDPQPAACNTAVTHPHVSEEHLCAGDAGTAMHAALVSGRICDFFTLARSVLTTYNADSPYVPLDTWFGVACYECGYAMPADETSWCRMCEQDFCNDCVSFCRSCEETTCLSCIGTCTACEEPICLSCLERCPVCEEPVCQACLTVCPECERPLCQLCLDEEQCPCLQQPEETDHDQAQRETTNRATRLQEGTQLRSTS